MKYDGKRKRSYDKRKSSTKTSVEDSSFKEAFSKTSEFSEQDHRQLFEQYYRHQLRWGTIHHGVEEDWRCFLSCLQTSLPSAVRLSSTNPCDIHRVRARFQSWCQERAARPDQDSNVLQGSAFSIRALDCFSPSSSVWDLNIGRMQLKKKTHQPASHAPEDSENSADIEDGVLDPADPNEVVALHHESSREVEGSRKLEEIQDSEKWQIHQQLVMENAAGVLTRQEVVSMIPVCCLNVHPGDHVLDMCAAPGSKTGQLLLSAVTSERGLVVANDISARRLDILIHQSQRLAQVVKGLVVINHDGAALPLPDPCPADERLQKTVQPRFFDAVLCDAMCSGDGTLRKSPDMWSRWLPHMGVSMHRQQVALVQRALRMLHPSNGGRVVYSTCSLNPIENEATVATVLKWCADASVRGERKAIKTGKFQRECALARVRLVPASQVTLRHCEGFDSSSSSLSLVCIGYDEHKIQTRAEPFERGNTKTFAYRSGLKSWKWMDSHGNWYDDYDKIPEEIRSRHKIPTSIFPLTNQPAGPEEEQGVGIAEEIMDQVESGCIRVLPHDNNTGGFFVATFELTPEPARGPPESTWMTSPRVTRPFQVWRTFGPVSDHIEHQIRSHYIRPEYQELMLDTLLQRRESRRSVKVYCVNSAVRQHILNHTREHTRTGTVDSIEGHAYNIVHAGAHVFTQPRRLGGLRITTLGAALLGGDTRNILKESVLLRISSESMMYLLRNPVDAFVNCPEIASLLAVPQHDVLILSCPMSHQQQESSSAGKEETQDGTADRNCYVPIYLNVFASHANEGDQNGREDVESVANISSASAPRESKVATWCLASDLDSALRSWMLERLSEAQS